MRWWWWWCSFNLSSNFPALLQRSLTSSCTTKKCVTPISDNFGSTFYWQSNSTKWLVRKSSSDVQNFAKVPQNTEDLSSEEVVLSTTHRIVLRLRMLAVCPSWLWPQSFRKVRYPRYEFVAPLEVTSQINFNDSHRSIRYGCQTVIEKSAADDSIRTYELLVDVAVSSKILH